MKNLSIYRSAIDIDVSAADWTQPAQTEPIGIQCNAATTITGALVGDKTETSWVLPAGCWPLAFRVIKTTSTTKTGFKVLFA